MQTTRKQRIMIEGIRILCAKGITLWCHGLGYWGDLSRAQAMAGGWRTCEAQSPLTGPHRLFYRRQDLYCRTDKIQWEGQLQKEQ